MGVQVDDIWTYELTNDTIVINSLQALKALSIYNTSSTNGTVTGGKPIKGFDSTPITIEEDGVLTLATGQATAVLGEVTITAPAGCTLKLVGSI